MTFRIQSWVRTLVPRWVFPWKGAGPSRMAMRSPGGRILIRQAKLAPDGVDFSEGVSGARWVKDELRAIVAESAPLTQPARRLRSIS